MSYNDPDNVKNKFKIIGEQYTNNEIQNELDRAHNKLDGQVGRTFTEVIRADIDEQEEWDLGFSEIIELHNIKILGLNEWIDSEKYTIDTDKGTVTFTTTYAEDKIERNAPFKFYYTPERFKELELWNAIQSIALTSTMQTREGEQAFDIEEIKNTVKNIKKEINMKTGNRKVKDHKNRFPVRNTR